MKVAVIHDWLVTYAGAERVLEQILQVVPEADLFSIIDFLPDEQRGFILNKRATTSFIQNLPLAKSQYRLYLPLMPTAIERLDVTGYDLVISSSYAVAKGVITSPEQLHVCYLQARNLKYAYEDRFLYPQGRFSGLLQDFFLSYMRVWDSVASRRPDVTIANSRYVANWHQRTHDVRSSVVYPPVDLSLFDRHFSETKADYYVTVGRLEPYKRVDLVIEAFNRLGHKLVVIGDGTERARLERLARSNIDFVGYQSSDSIAHIVSKAHAFVFASREDFGIAPLEAQACGTPVIAYGKGGVLETVVEIPNPQPTGLLFDSQTAEALVEAIDSFENNKSRFRPEDARDNARRFSQEKFRKEFRELIQAAWKDFREEVTGEVASPARVS